MEAYIEELFTTLGQHMEISFVVQHFSIIVSILIVGCEKPKTKKGAAGILILAAVSILMLMLICCMLLMKDPTLFEILWIPIQLIYLLGILCLTNHFRWTTRITLFFTHATVLTALMPLVNEASQLGSYYLVSDGILWAIRSFSSLLSVFCAVLVRRWNIDRYGHMTRAVVVLSAVIAAITYYFQLYVTYFGRIYGAESFYDHDVMLLLFFFFISLIVIDLIYCYMLNRFCEMKAKVAELQVDARDRERVEELMTVSEENAERMREVRHDIKNQFTYLNVLADKGNAEDIRKYLHELSYDFLKPLKSIDCGNRHMNAILNMELSKAEKRGIILDAQIIVPSELPFQESDLCSLVANVIDNALEGWVKTEKETPVTVRMVMQGEELLLSVTNPTDKEPSFLENVHSTKEDREAHGYGRRIVERIVSRYHGYASYDIQNGIFSFNCVLNAEDDNG